jgi:hypothetical protein
MHTHGFLEYAKIRYALLCVVFCFALLIYQSVYAATIATYSDRLSDSGPNEYSNHTINFTTTVSVPAGGFIRFTPEDGDFNIPAVDFDIDNVALYVDSGSGYTLRQATGTQSATDDGIQITTGTSGNIEVTLNSTEGIPANADVRLVIGSSTPNATTTDVGILNPSATGTFSYLIEAGDGVTDAQVTGLVAIIDKVHIDDVDTTETVPPVRFNGLPSGEISGTTQQVQISFETDEFALCRYSTASGTPFASMGNIFGTTFSTIHSKVVAVSSSTVYSFFIRCTDDEDNVNPDDYEITFEVLPYPEGEPGGDGEEQGEGEGTGDGSGDADPGNGSTGNSGNSGGGGGGGGSGGGSSGGAGSSSSGAGGGGGFEGTNKAYQSGDGQVIINGYAFPQSTIVILVDGQIADEVRSDGDGEFSVTLDEIARGAYTFGVYGIDKNGTKSSTFSTTFTITGSRGSTLSNINVMPSIKVSPDPVQPGGVLTVSGYAIPDATITIENQNDKSSASLKTFTVTSNAQGAWTTTIPTDGFTKGTYKVRAKAKQETGVSTNFSGYTFYGVGEAAKVAGSSDLNRDGKVNLTDFSILLFWWNTDGGASNPPADINGDGKVSLTDFSIMIFNWTG